MKVFERNLLRKRNFIPFYAHEMIKIFYLYSYFNRVFFLLLRRLLFENLIVLPIPGQKPGEWVVINASFFVNFLCMTGNQALELEYKGEFRQKCSVVVMSQFCKKETFIMLEVVQLKSLIFEQIPPGGSRLDRSPEIVPKEESIYINLINFSNFYTLFEFVSSNPGVTVSDP